MLLNDLSELPEFSELATIINVGTKYVSTLALLSALRYTQMPVVMLDCASRDGSYEWFTRISAEYPFYLMRAPLRQHGETLDAIFQKVRAKRLLLVDSDVEVLNTEMISRMRVMMDASPQVYGSGYLHPAHWLECHYWTDLPLAPGIGYYMARPWIPFTLLRVDAVRAALGNGRSFMHRLVLNDVPQFPALSRLLWGRFRLPFFRRHRLGWLDVTRRQYNGEKPSYLSYDTGADIHEFLIEKQNLRFQSVSADFVPWSVTHFSGITRGSLHDGATDDAYKISDAQPIVVKRLRDVYGLEISNMDEGLTGA
jgi:hypothetical protein